jgi:hypothetical protein
MPGISAWPGVAPMWASEGTMKLKRIGPMGVPVGQRGVRT